MKYKLTILATLLLGVFAQAQEQLSLKDAIEYALANKADAVKAKLDIQNSEHKIAEVRAMALPQITVSGDLTYNAILQKSALPGDILGQPGTTILVPFGQPWQSTASANLDQQIFNQAVFTGLKAARTTREFYQINNTLTEEQVIEKVANAYYQVYETKLQLKTIEIKYESTSKTADVIKGLYENGLAKKIDLDRMLVSKNNLEANITQTKNALQLQENSLKFMIGMGIQTPIVMPDNTFEISAHVFVDENTTIDNRTEILVLEKQNELLELDKKSKIAEYYPTLSLRGSFGYLGLGSDFPWFSKPADGTYWSSFSAIGLNLSIPVFNGFSTRSKVRQADVAIEKAQVELEETRLALSLDLENAKTQINNSLLTIDSQKTNVDLAKEVLENIQNNYNNGLATLTDLLDAETAYADAQNNYTDALLKYKLAEIQLIKSKGELKSLINN
ncbi:TolC family protein [Myroides ceti]|uniref:TolC family protein n=1 Tax=Paenimyroides ceti TaxID=395087 RepID=A0ABT8CX72_9FLAO|nr:TolC family protein [Paenimyroides ceti]MDN3708162.1 TolC family protein [Paenimyroides ceti]